MDENVFFCENQLNVSNWNFRRTHTGHAQDEFAELLNDKRLQLEFSKQSLAYVRGGQIAARGPNVARHSVFSGPRKHSRKSSN